MEYYSIEMEKEVRQRANESRYWKQSIVCKYAYKLRITMKEAWELLRFYAEDYFESLAYKMIPKQNIGLMEYADLSNEYGVKGKYYGD